MCIYGRRTRNNLYCREIKTKFSSASRNIWSMLGEEYDTCAMHIHYLYTEIGTENIDVAVWYSFALLVFMIFRCDYNIHIILLKFCGSKYCEVCLSGCLYYLIFNIIQFYLLFPRYCQQNSKNNCFQTSLCGEQWDHFF